jgi:hypothetical protein
MIVSKAEQGSFEWLFERVAVVTGTRVKDIVTPAKLQLSKSSKDLILKLIDEKITGISSESTFVSDAMERGSNLEDQAKEEYTKRTGIVMMDFGLCISKDNKMHGLSPDGFTEDLTGGVEIKCPSYTHLKYITGEKSIYNEYKPQCINYFLVNKKLEWLDTVSFRPEFYPNPIYIKRITREEIKEDIELVEVAMDEFFKEYNNKFTELTF